MQIEGNKTVKKAFSKFLDIKNNLQCLIGFVNNLCGMIKSNRY
ncbi:hypothetical protein M23134_05748 [Microscilla marina ATCC 23134]|uniref:Uncharacterized protein n=1 Tax=Microscilla marina ATCC 23134 TaxID=313606 RepID=A1ZIK7_MICM2|nr:hypothetical protein M23134_05748 [Microscilla marina ATCC 23134]